MTSRNGRTDDETTSNIPSLSTEKQQQEVREAIVDAFDEAKNSTQKAAKDVKKEVPRYTEAINNYREKMLEAAREITENYIDSQKEIISLFRQSKWVSRLRDTNETRQPNLLSLTWMTEAFTKMTSTYMDNMIAELRLLNNMLSLNTEIYKTSLRQIKDNLNMFSKIAVDNAKTFENTMKLYKEPEPVGRAEKEIHKSQ
jgi:predicted O-linked N-acetylglucosamine transferase (SPINDLY family)